MGQFLYAPTQGHTHTHTHTHPTYPPYLSHSLEGFLGLRRPFLAVWAGWFHVSIGSGIACWVLRVPETAVAYRRLK